MSGGQFNVKTRRNFEKKEDRKIKLQTSLDSIVSQLKRVGALKIILFGSFAKGEVDVHSDLDLLVIMPATKSGKEWMKIIYEKVERGCASDIIAYNQEEFEDKLPKSSFLRNILSFGKGIYEKTV